MTEDAISEVPVLSKHPLLWYEDGTVILAAKTTLFRVYRGILAQNSPVFRDMFSISQPTSTSHEETIDGLKVVQMHDEPDELAHFLRALHDQSYYSCKGKVEYDVVKPILRLGTKYQVKHLRDHALSLFKTRFVSSVEEFDTGRLCQWQNALVQMQNIYQHYDCISLFRECGAMILIPHAMYSLTLGNLHCDQGPGESLPSMTPGFLALYEKLSTGDLVAIFAGREYITRAIREEVNKVLLQTEPVLDGCAANLKKKMVESTVWPPTLIWWDLMSGEICLPCRLAMEKSRATVDSACLIWERLHKYFGLDEWDVLRSSTEEYLKL